MGVVVTRAQRADRRTDALSRQRIVATAIQILDEEGEAAALTFRALATRLATGPGAIYWHVANKDELLAAATDEVLAASLTGATDGAEPRAAIRGLSLGLFDAIDAHPWVGAQLAGTPWQAALMQVFEGIGSALQELGVAESEQFDSASALLSYVLGVAGQNAANARSAESGMDRTAFLQKAAAQWDRLDETQYPFLRRVAARFAEHDDREQFLAGIELILGGISVRMA